MSKSFTGTVDSTIVKKASYDFVSKQQHHRKPVYSDLSFSGGNIFVLTSPEMLDIPAALECGISPSRLYLTSRELTVSHTSTCAANVILASDILLAAAKLARSGIYFSGVNLDGTWAMSEEMLARMHSLGASNIWDGDAIISCNLPCVHNDPTLAKAKTELLKDEQFVTAFADAFNIHMPTSYVSKTLPPLIGPLAALYSFAVGAGSSIMPYGSKFGVYNGKDDDRSVKMGWVTCRLTSCTSNAMDDLMDYIKDFNSLLIGT